MSQNGYTVTVPIEDEIREKLKADERPDGEIAAAAGMNRVHLNRFKRGTGGLNASTFERLATALGLQVLLKPAPKNPRKS